MRKIGLILDSSVGLTMLEANERGHALIPLQIIINGVTRRAGIDITTEELLSEMNANKADIEIMTSLPNGTDIEKALDWILERYEKAVYIGMSSGLSGTFNAVRTVCGLEEKYMERILCYESEFSSPWIRAYLEEFEEILENYSDFDEITKILDLVKPYLYGHLAPGDIYWFYKGGRLSKMQYIAGSLLKIKPILTIEDGTLSKEKIEKCRGIDKAMDRMVEMVKEQIEVITKQGLEYRIMTMDSSEPEYTEKMLAKIKENFNVDRNDVVTLPVSTEQSAHMGPGAFGLAAIVEYKELTKKKG